MTIPKRGTSAPGTRGRTPIGPIRVSNRLRGESPNPPSTRVEPQSPNIATPQHHHESPKNDEQGSIAINKDDSTKSDSGTNIGSNVDEYPNSYYDPDPLPNTSSETQKSEYLAQIHKMGQDTLETYKELELKGEDLWIEFITVFRPHTIKLWNHLLISKWIRLFKTNDVHIEKGRTGDKAQKLVNLLFRAEHIGTDGVEKDFQKPFPQRLFDKIEQVTPIKDQATESVPQDESSGRVGHYAHPDRLKLISGDNVEVNAQGFDKERYEPTPIINNKSAVRMPSGGPPDDDDDDDDSDDDPNKDRSNTGDGGGLKSNPQDTYIQNSSVGKQYDERRGLGINGLMRAFQGKQTFSGSWEEDLDCCINIFNTLAVMCEVSMEDKLKAIPVMLTGDALNYYANNASSCIDFDQAMCMLRKWYNSDDRKARILTKWQSMKLSEAMNEDPGESEATVFRKFTAALMSLQNQLDVTYHEDKFLRDRLLTAVDIPSIQSSLRDRLPRTSQQAINRVAIQLSDRKRSAGGSSACITQDDDDDKALYSLGKSYGGEARRDVKKPWNSRNNKGSNNYGKDKSNGNRGSNSSWDNNRKRLNSNWMRGIKGCFVYCRIAV